MRKRIIKTLILTLMLVSLLTSCTNIATFQKNLKPQISQMRSICELATMECYYHNVAKYYEKDASKILFWGKDKNFWIEYSGTVRIGIDASLVSLEVDETKVTATIPEAKVIGYKVDETSFTDKSFIVAKGSADVKAEDETKALAEAQEHMLRTASSDSKLLASAQQRAQALIEDYIENIGQAVGKEYKVEWKYIGAKGDSGSNSAEETQDSEDNKDGN